MMKFLALSLFSQKITIPLCYVSIFVSFAIIGWLLNGYMATQIVCIGTLTMICYLTWVGSGAIALVSVWVVGLMSMAAIHQLWLHDLPRPEFRFIPMLLLINWLFALGVVGLLGKASDFLRQRYVSRTWGFSALIGLVVAGLVLGWQLYPETLLFFSSF
jgi:hypothetical protein